jgi:hypothetical protein
MATYRQPIESQPEFDEYGPLTVGDRLILRIARPFIHLTQLFTMPGRLYRGRSIPLGYAFHIASDHEWSMVPTKARVYFERTEATLARLGFVGARHQGCAVSEVSTAYASIVVNPTTNTLATIVAGVVPRRFMRIRLSFHTWWTNGTRTVTTNNEEAELLSHLYEPPAVDPLTLPGLEDVDRLHDIHQERCHEPRLTVMPIGEWDDPARGPLALVARIQAEWEQQMFDAGLWRRVDARTARLTWKGAILFAWSRIEPIESYLERKGRARTASAV